MRLHCGLIKDHNWTAHTVDSQIKADRYNIYFVVQSKRNYYCDNNTVDSDTRHCPHKVNYNAFSRTSYRLVGLDLQCSDVINRLLTKLIQFGFFFILCVYFIIYFRPKDES